MLNRKKFRKNASSCFLIFLMMLLSLTITKKIEAQTLPYWLYYPADAISLYGTPSIFLPPPPAAVGGTLPYNIFGTAPSILVPPPVPANIAASVTPFASTLLSRIALTTISPLTAPSLFPFFSPLDSVIPAVLPNIYNLYYPAVGSVPGTFISPPAATGVGTFPYNLYYPAIGSVPGSFLLPPV